MPVATDIPTTGQQTVPHTASREVRKSIADAIRNGSTVEEQVALTGYTGNYVRTICRDFGVWYPGRKPPKNAPAQQGREPRTKIPPQKRPGARALQDPSGAGPP